MGIGIDLYSELLLQNIIVIGLFTALNQWGNVCIQTLSSITVLQLVVMPCLVYIHQFKFQPFPNINVCGMFQTRRVVLTILYWIGHELAHLSIHIFSKSETAANCT